MPDYNPNAPMWVIFRQLAEDLEPVPTPEYSKALIHLAIFKLMELGYVELRRSGPQLSYKGRLFYLSMSA